MRNVLNRVRQRAIERYRPSSHMNFRSLILSTLALAFLIGTSSAAEHRRREYRAKQAKVPTARLYSQKALRLHGPQLGSRNGPVTPYSSRGHVMRPYHGSKSIRGGGRGTIRVLR